MSKQILAAMAAIPARRHRLREALESLRPQVDRLHVYLNGFREVPDCVSELADDFVQSQANEGAEKKFHWCGKWQGYYFTVDDDLGYPKEYVQTMLEHVDRWDGEAIVSCHGRVYPESPTNYYDLVQGTRGIYHQRIPRGRWVNHAGTGVMAWDASKIRVPDRYPYKNMADMQLSIWAQLAKIPLWLVPHRERWFVQLNMGDMNTLWRRSCAEGHKDRLKLLKEHADSHGWRLYGRETSDGKSQQRSG